MDLITRKDDERLMHVGSWDVSCGFELLRDSLRASLEREAALLKRAEEAEGHAKTLEEYMLKGVAFRDELQAQLCAAREALKKCAIYASSNPNNIGPLTKSTFPPSAGELRRLLACVESVANAALSSSTPCPHKEEAERLREGLKCVADFASMPPRVSHGVQKEEIDKLIANIAFDLLKRVEYRIRRAEWRGR